MLHALHGEAKSLAVSLFDIFYIDTDYGDRITIFSCAMLNEHVLMNFVAPIIPTGLKLSRDTFLLAATPIVSRRQLARDFGLANTLLVDSLFNRGFAKQTYRYSRRMNMCAVPHALN